jgi:uncharacterized membrane-anchored protein YhcB (DUF1043 family)
MTETELLNTRIKQLEKENKELTASLDAVKQTFAETEKEHLELKDKFAEQAEALDKVTRRASIYESILPSTNIQNGAKPIDSKQDDVLDNLLDDIKED